MLNLKIRGFFSDKFKQSVFTFYSNGILTRLTSENREKSIDLKCVVKQISIESAIDYIEKINNLKKNKLLNPSDENIISFSTSHHKNSNNSNSNNNNNDGTNKKCTDESITINIHDVIDGDKKIYLKDAMLMFIPIKSGSKKKWILLFPEFEKLRYTTFFCCCCDLQVELMTSYVIWSIFFSLFYRIFN